ncbi:cytochrome P450 [Cladochytrium replicatum]|nr:cytochrome P450 [Cladochytrium replicatum]
MSLSLFTLFVGTLIIGGSLIILLFKLAPPRYRFPPGPTPLPVLGSAHLITTKPHRALAALSKTYGPLFTIYLGPNPALIISDAGLSRKLFANAPFLSRTDTDIRMGIFGLNNTSLIALGDTDAWRSMRRRVHSILNESAVQRIGPVIDGEIDGVIQLWGLEAEKSPTTKVGSVKPRKMLKFMIANIIFDAVYGFRYSDIKDPEFERFHSVSLELARLAGIKRATDIIMQFVPGSEVSQLAALGDELAEYHRSKIRRLQALIDAGESAPDCFTTACLKQGGEDNSIETVLKMSRDIIGGAFDTSTTVLEWIIVLLVNNPEAQQKAHEELDRVVGRGRTPTYEDQEKLIYLKSIIRETLRIRPPAPLGIPHAASEDAEFEFNGETFLIPKGTMIMTNITAIHEQLHPDSPEVFRPERHVDIITASDSKLGYVQDNLMTFSTGRRICPGISLSARVMFMTTARMLQRFEFLPVDGKGLSMEEEDGLTVMAPDFSVLVKKRF